MIVIELNRLKNLKEDKYGLNYSPKEKKRRPATQRLIESPKRDEDSNQNQKLKMKTPQISEWNLFYLSIALTLIGSFTSYFIIIESASWLVSQEQITRLSIIILITTVFTFGYIIGFIYIKRKIIANIIQNEEEEKIETH
jgi:hypothetical protein